METAIYTTIYNRKKSLSKNGTALIQIEIYFNRKRKYISTSIYIRPDQWDNKNRKVKNHPNGIKINKHISDLTTGMQGYELDQRNAGKPFNMELLTEYINGNITKSFTEFIEREIKRGNTASSTKVTQTTTLKRLKEFRKDVLFTDCNVEFLASFERFLKLKKLSVNTINKYFRHLRTFYNLAINQDLVELSTYPFRKFKLHTEETHRQPITPEEITAIEAVNIPPELHHLQKVKDMFLLACYTGLRFSDLTALKPEHFITRDKQYFIDTKMVKTKTHLTIPITELNRIFRGNLMEIVSRYIDRDRPFMFDELTNQYVNRCLKELAELAGITSLVTFHTARHTLATFLIGRGVPITTVQRLLGHKKLATTMIYTKVHDTVVINDLRHIEA